MKTNFVLTQTVLLVVMATLGVGCSSSSSNNTPQVNTSTTYPNPYPYTTYPTTTTGTTTGTAGVPNTNTVAFVPVSAAAMAAYVATHPLNNPQNITVSVNVADVAVGSNQYGGSMQISYSDTGVNYAGNFITGTGTVQVSGSNLDTGKSVAAFNKWFASPTTGQQVFHGFFQDKYGAMVLVVDSVTSTTGDGLAPNSGAGSVWFKNFPNGYATQSPEMCWFIQIGPYNCRTFLSGINVVTTSAVYPGNGFQQLGTFTGLNIKQAFNQ
jgi:hypothetical protein